MELHMDEGPNKDEALPNHTKASASMQTASHLSKSTIHLHSPEQQYKRSAITQIVNKLKTTMIGPHKRKGQTSNQEMRMLKAMKDIEEGS